MFIQKNIKKKKIKDHGILKAIALTRLEWTTYTKILLCSKPSSPLVSQKTETGACQQGHPTSFCCPRAGLAVPTQLFATQS